MDLNEIAFIDKNGERLLRLLLKERAQCIASADYTKHVLEKLTTKGFREKLSLVPQLTQIDLENAT